MVNHLRSLFLTIRMMRISPTLNWSMTFFPDLGFKTTKSVWPIKGNQAPLIGGTTCENAEYLDWVLRLQESGFEIGLHNVTFHTSSREETIRGIDRFRELFGHDPYSLTNHSGAMKASIGVMQG